MNLQSLKNTEGARHRSKRVGRGHGSGRGKTSCRGHKGQGARAGSGYKPTFEGGQMPLIRRLPKFGFKNPNRRAYIPVNVGALEVFDANADVTPETLRGKGLAKGKLSGIKILGRGELTKALTVKAHAFSASAKSKIEAAGGTAEQIESS